jgi:hypothetical protein
MGPSEAIDRRALLESYRGLADRLAQEADQRFAEGRCAEAEQALRELLQLQTRVLGENHADYADTLSKLGELCYMRNDLQGAEEKFRRALEIRRRVLGERHLDYATNLNSLALVVWRQSGAGAAEPLLRCAHAIRQQLLGELHPDTLRTRNALEAARTRRGNPHGSEPQKPADRAASEGSFRHQGRTDEVAHNANLKARHETARRNALVVLDALLRVAHRARNNFAPLVECQARVRALRENIATAPWDMLPREASDLAGGKHPFAHLLSLINDREGLTDVDWARLYRSVGNALGLTLAAAASCGSLTLSAQPPGTPDEPPPPSLSSAEPPDDVTRRNDEPVDHATCRISFARVTSVQPDSKLIGGPLALVQGNRRLIFAGHHWDANETARFVVKSDREESFPGARGTTESLRPFQASSRPPGARRVTESLFVESRSGVS